MSDYSVESYEVADAMTSFGNVLRISAMIKSYPGAFFMVMPGYDVQLHY